MRIDPAKMGLKEEEVMERHDLRKLDKRLRGFRRQRKNRKEENT